MKISLWLRGNSTLLLTIAFLVNMLACRRYRTPNCYIFPSGYTGWAAVDYEVVDAPPLIERDGCYWIDFRQSSRIATSSKVSDGWAADKHFEGQTGRLAEIGEFADSQGRQPRGHAIKSSGKLNPQNTTETLFLGTAEDYRRMSKEEPLTPPVRDP